MCLSVEKRVIQRFFVPNTRSVENKHFLSLGTSEDHLLVKHEHIPKQSAFHMIFVNFFQRVDIDKDSVDSSKEFYFVKNYLLCVG